MHYVKTFFRLLLGVFMTYAGFSHLTFNRLAFVAQVPMWLRFSDGFTDFVVVASGVVEIALGLAMLFPFRHKAKVGALLALFYVLIFPGNLNQYFYHIDSFGLVTDTQRLIRLFFQPVLIALALGQRAVGANGRHGGAPSAAAEHGSARSPRKLERLEHSPCALTAKRALAHRSDAATRTFLSHDNEKSR